MTIIQADGTLSTVGEILIKATATPSTLVELSLRTGIQTKQIREPLQEMLDVGLLVIIDDHYTLTEDGEDWLAELER